VRTDDDVVSAEIGPWEVEAEQNQTHFNYHRLPSVDSSVHHKNVVALTSDGSAGTAIAARIASIFSICPHGMVNIREFKDWS
jgi:hypothetical protein